MWYISYYLPNNRRVQRPVHKDFREAKKLSRIKELKLLQHKFDSKDLNKLEGFLPETKEPERLSIDTALLLYFEVTKPRKTAKTYYNDSMAITRYFSFLRKSSKEYMDEIAQLDVHRLVGLLDKDGKSEATIKNAVTMVRKVFNCLIDEIKLIFGENPVPSKMKLPKKNGLVRNRLATDFEIQALLHAEGPKVGHSSSVSPVKEIVRFLVFTGAGVSEALHAEWSDFDLERGIWRIGTKPNCPTLEGLGWAPKWRKERTVVLFREVIDLLGSMPMVESVGTVLVRDRERRIVDRRIHPAGFVFPKKDIVRRKDGSTTILYSRVDSIKTAWKSLVARAGVSNLQIKDLRTYFNHKLKSRYGFSSKEAGVYIGNSQEVNDLHYTPVCQEQIRNKMGLFSLEEAMGVSEEETLLN